MNCVKISINDLPVYTFPMKVKDVVSIYYVAVRGRDHEKGAVQRVLNKRRIKSITDFVLAGNVFYNTFILNWTNQDALPGFNSNKIKIQTLPSSAQVIDGQHRLAGLEEAMEQSEAVGEKEILISLTVSLTTKQAAMIFSNINSEQKPVPKSLLYDLFGEIEDDQDHAINRATDIAGEFNTNLESPYYQNIKYPGAPRRVGVLDLASVVSSLKKHLEPGGTFSAYNVRLLDNQKSALLNYFNAIKNNYEENESWNNNKKNPFIKSAGFNGAIDALCDTFLGKCAELKSFKIPTFNALLDLDPSTLLYQEDIKNLDGKSARRKVKEFLEYNIKRSIPGQDEYEF